MTLYKLKEFIDESPYKDEIEEKAVTYVNKFIADNNIKEWYVESYCVVRYEEINQDRAYILIKYKDDTQ